MKCVIPYQNIEHGHELKYCLRSIEKFVNNSEIVIIGDLPKWVKNVKYIPFKDRKEVQYKERNIYEKLQLVKEDFIFFNDDHFLLESFNYEYHYTGTLEVRMIEYKGNPFSKTLKNTIELFGNIKNYYRHQPIFINYEIFKKINLDWNVPWGYCVKSIYCHLAGIEGIEYPDLKIRRPMKEQDILKLIEGRAYFSTVESCINRDMVRVLEGLYKEKSNYEL